jgi:Tfp pilus assembly major pilin PilA
MYLVIDRLVEALASGSEPLLSAERMGPRKPTASVEIPAVVFSLQLDQAKGAGLGRFVRAGDTIVKSTNIIQVALSVDTFAENLRTLRIAPLPLKRNPSSTSTRFGASDISIKNVTDQNNEITYTFTDKPAQPNEYTVKTATAEIIFGAAQTPNDKLEVAHWTVTWRDEILGDIFRGQLAMEVWANSISQSREVSRKLQDKLKTDRSLLRNKGFVDLKPAALKPAENMTHVPVTGSSFPVWIQTLEYKFTFEAEDGGELSSGIPIKRIDVDMDDFIVEQFSVP